VGWDKVHAAGANAALQVTALPRSAHPGFEDHTLRYLQHTSLAAIQWINITRRQLTFKTIHRKASL
jgi:hypothetical protein